MVTIANAGTIFAVDLDTLGSTIKNCAVERGECHALQQWPG